MVDVTFLLGAFFCPDIVGFDRKSKGAHITCLIITFVVRIEHLLDIMSHKAWNVQYLGISGILNSYHS